MENTFSESVSWKRKWSKKYTAGRFRVANVRKTRLLWFAEFMSRSYHLHLHFCWSDRFTIHNLHYATCCIKCVGNVKEVQANNALVFHWNACDELQWVVQLGRGTQHYVSWAGTLLWPTLKPNWRARKCYARVYLCTVNLTQVFGKRKEDDTWSWRGQLAEEKHYSRDPACWETGAWALES